MSNRSILKIAALLGGIGWAIYLATQWNDYFTAISALENNPFGKLAMELSKEKFDALRNRLIFQSCGALILVVVGISIKDDENTNVITDFGQSNNQPYFSQNTSKEKQESQDFIGERIISNDKYKLFLVDKYQIKKNEVLNQYLCDEKLFPSVDEALLHAASIEEVRIKEITANELLRLKNEQEKIAAAAERLRLEKKKAEEIELQKQITWKLGAPKRRKIFITTLLLSSSFALWWYFSSQKEIHIKSNSIEFSGAKLGGKIKDYKFGDQLEIDGGPYFFTKNRALLSYELDEKIDDKWKHAPDGKITGITFECEDSVFGRSIGLASIDGFSCSSSTSELVSAGWKKLCDVYDFSSFAEPLKGIYLKNNAFFEDRPSKNSLPKISSFGLKPNLNSYNAYQECASVEKLKIKAKKEGYKSLGEMMIDGPNQTSDNNN